jgi:transcriptional regulator with GAF, ATPase, and Fis domain
MTATIVYRSNAQKKLLARLAKVAKTTAEVLITGPTGVGKELYAAHVHRQSPRADKAFVVVNCANLPPETIENEIFGHARGAFTGAVKAEHGIAAAADGGTLFLDEIDALPLPCQAKILRFAQFREYRRLGEAFTRKCDVRLIAASNADLFERVRARTFREDLYFRLRVVPVEIPPLAQRPEDIPALLEHFVAKYACDYGVDPVVFEAATLERLMSYSWPGNVRELENCVRYLTCLGLDRPVRSEDMQLLDDTSLAQPESSDVDAEVSELVGIPLKEAKSIVVTRLEKMYIDNALRDASGCVARAAEKSGKHRRAFFELMRRHGITAGAYRGH